MPITLPKDPTGEQYEDLVAAALTVGGNFVEAQMKLRDDGHEILELDVVATPVGGGADDRRLYEVKKQPFSFTNLFKLHGQSMFLGVPRAALISASGCEPHKRPTYQQRAAEMGIDVCHLPPEVDQLGALGPRPNGLPDARFADLTAAAWFGTIGRRVALGELRNEVKANRGKAQYEAPRLYEFNSRASFFLKSPLERAEALYNAYFARPKMSGALVELDAGGSDVAEAWNRVNDSHQRLPIQAVMDLESKARLAIVKNALDDYLARGGAPPPTTVLKFGSAAFEVPIHGLPNSFSAGLTALAAHPRADRLPYLYQAFYLLLGGYVSLERPDDLELLEELSGVPACEVEGSLMLLDNFFGADKSFFFRPRDALLVMKMVPGVVRGAGSIFRQRAYGFTDYTTQYPTMGWLMGKWHDALYYALQPYL